MVVSDGWVVKVTEEVDTIKLPELVAVMHPTVTLMGPVVAPGGTEVVMVVAVLEDTVAGVPLKRTIFSVGVVLKFVPVIIKSVPTGALVGAKFEMVGERFETMLR